MAGRTKRGWEARGNVIRHTAAKRLRALPGGDVAAVAIRVRHSKRIVVPHVAIGAGYDFTGRLQLVRAREWPACRAVIEDRGVPGDRAMACRAIRRRKGCSSVRVYWVVGLLPGRQVALRVSTVGRRYG